MPVIELTMEQQFQLRKLTDQLSVTDKDELIASILMLQRQNFIQINIIQQFLKEWPNHLNGTTTTGE